MGRELPAAGELTAGRVSRPRRVLLLGATGTIGRATARALRDRGHDVVAFVRPAGPTRAPLPPGVEVRTGEVTDALSVRRDGFRGESFDTVVSCLASRTGAPRDAWAVDHGAHVGVLEAAREGGVERFVLLSALCVQKPRLEFQLAKRAFEEALLASDVEGIVVRPTAFFKSLSGQLGRIRRGRPFLVIGDGSVTSCKPIGDDDLATYLADRLDDPVGPGRVLPVGGPGPALTAREQGELLFEAAGIVPRFRSVPPRVLDGVVGVLTGLGRVSRTLRDKAELARIGRYYATESMLVWDAVAGRYDADATPEFGSDTLASYYRRLVRGEVADERGDHALFRGNR